MSDVAIEDFPARHRWADYIVGREDGRYGYAFDELLQAGQRKGQPSLYVMGLGFDPRATVAFEVAAPLLPPGSKVIAVVPRTSSGGVSREAMFQKENAARAFAIAADHGLQVDVIEPNPEGKDPRFHGLWLTRRLSLQAEWEYKHVVVDISSLPSAIFFALIRAWLDRKTPGFQLQVVAAESHWLDDLILDSGTLSPQFLPGFNEHGQFGRVKDAKGTRIWIPVLGHERAAQLEAIADVFNPHEICPVLPFPSEDPRRGDTLVAEYGQLLFETLNVDAQKFIYADASNPFDLYRVLLTMCARYERALSPLGPCVIVPTAHGSKLLSLGVLLGAVEAGLSVGNAGSPRSALSAECTDESLRALAAESQRTCLWIEGEPYDRSDAEQVDPAAASTQDGDGGADPSEDKTDESAPASVGA